MTVLATPASTRSLLGLSTYAYFWQWSDENPRPLTLTEMLHDAAGLGADVFQICDYPPLEGLAGAELTEVRRLSERLGLQLEVGTRGIRPSRLLRYLGLAQSLGSSFVRSMIQPADTELSVVPMLLREVLGAYEQAEVNLGLETYEQLSTRELLDVVRGIDSPYLGVVLDPGNSVAALELPSHVVESTADYVMNLHIKDFDFIRQPGWVGFIYTGARLGEGLLDYDYMVSVVRPTERGINQIVEHWLPWQGEMESTIAAEREWTLHSMTYLRSRSS